MTKMRMIMMILTDDDKLNSNSDIDENDDGDCDHRQIDN